MNYICLYANDCNTSICIHRKPHDYRITCDNKPCIHLKDEFVTCIKINDFKNEIDKILLGDL